MKLEHYNKSVPASEYSELDFLKAENAFLQDELKLQEIEHSLELYETILDCISKEGKVSKSLELMFGENASSLETFETELKEQYEQALEGYLKTTFDEKTEEWRDLRATFPYQHTGWVLKAIKDCINYAHSFSYKVRFPKTNSFNVIGAKIERLAKAKDINEVKEIAKEIEKERKFGDFSLTKYVTLENKSDLEQFIRECSSILGSDANRDHLRFGPFQEAKARLRQLLPPEERPILNVLTRFINTFYRTKYVALGRAVEDLRKLMGKDVNSPGSNATPEVRKVFSDNKGKFNLSAWTQSK